MVIDSEDIAQASAPFVTLNMTMSALRQVTEEIAAVIHLTPEGKPTEPEMITVRALIAYPPPWFVLIFPRDY